MKILVVFILLIVIDAFHRHNHHSNFINSDFAFIHKLVLKLSSNIENGVDLSSLTNHNVDGTYLKESISNWLGNEYIPQKVHIKIGLEVEKIYKIKRTEGFNDLGDILMETGYGLESFDMEDAFVNAWDIANKVSDFLLLRMGRETCDCAGDLSTFAESKEIDIDYVLFKSNVISFKSEFARYKLLKTFLDGTKTIISKIVIKFFWVIQAII
jgi:hypothetical protein